MGYASIYAWILITGIHLLSGPRLFAQELVGRSSDGVWEILTEPPPTAKAGQAWIRPLNFSPVRLNLERIDENLSLIAHERDAGGSILELPMPDRTFEEFLISRTDLLHPDLSFRYPGIMTFCGQGISDSTATVRIDRTPACFHAQVISVGGPVYIDPYSGGDPIYHSSYYRGDYKKGVPGWTCQFDPLLHGAGDPRKGGEKDGSPAHGDILRTCRLAIAAPPGEHPVFHSGGSPTVAEGLAAIITTVNRVVGIYERELAVRLQIVAKTTCSSRRTRFQIPIPI
jgi:hypothetical protein